MLTGLCCCGSTHVSLPFIFWKRLWRWILMMGSWGLPACESRAPAVPLRSTFPFAHTEVYTDVERDAVCTHTHGCMCVCAWAQRQVHLQADLVVQREQRVMHVKMFTIYIYMYILKKTKNLTPIPSRLWTFLYVTWMAWYPTHMTHHQYKGEWVGGGLT